ncbi:hypothetical protein B0H19DRAFT_138114 [Mycena capillaripes]|nr:hypothetical protein B0H19DRAFT_138114 [Mycena capillaripes]
MAAGYRKIHGRSPSQYCSNLWISELVQHTCYSLPRRCGLNLECDLVPDNENLDLIPFRHFLDLYRHSPILTVYVYAYSYMEFRTAKDYFFSAFQHFLCTFWIRRSTGRLCAELVPNNDYLLCYGGIASPQTIKVLDTPNQETMVVDSLTLDQYYKICYWELSRIRHLYGSAQITVNLGAIILCSAGVQLEDSVEIALLPDEKVNVEKWENTREAMGETRGNGWIR